MSEHYFTEQPSSERERRRLELRLRGHDVSVWTEGGVFSQDRVDLGTRVLLREAPDLPATGQLLDLGCGWGPIALAMALDSPAATVWAVDVNARAVALTADNAAALGLDGVRARAPAEVPADVSFDVIWSNPPIRIGKDALHSLLRQWIPRLASRRCGLPRRPAQPRCRLPARLAAVGARRGPRAAVRRGAPGQRQGLPRAGGPAAGLVDGWSQRARARGSRPAPSLRRGAPARPPR